MSAKSGDAWDKLRDLIEAAKEPSSTLSQTLRTASPAEVAEILETTFQITGRDMAELMSDLELIADRNSLNWWSPIH